LKEGKIFYESWSKQPLQNAFKPCGEDKGIFLLAIRTVYKYKSHVRPRLPPHKLLSIL